MAKIKDVTLSSQLIVDVLELANHEHYCGESYENGPREAELHVPLIGGKMADCKGCRSILELRNALISQGIKEENWDKEPIELIEEEEENDNE